MDYFVIATAPSMDGYASGAAQLIVRHMKTTYEVRLPKAILADIKILCEAPMEMINAGFGVILGNYFCLADWKMAHSILGEYRCPYVESLVKDSTETVVSVSYTHLPRILLKNSFHKPFSWPHPL